MKDKELENLRTGEVSHTQSGAGKVLFRWYHDRVYDQSFQNVFSTFWNLGWNSTRLYVFTGPGHQNVKKFSSQSKYRTLVWHVEKRPQVCVNPAESGPLRCVLSPLKRPLRLLPRSLIFLFLPGKRRETRKFKQGSRKRWRRMLRSRHSFWFKRSAVIPLIETMSASRISLAYKVYDLLPKFIILLGPQWQVRSNEPVVWLDRGSKRKSWQQQNGGTAFNITECKAANGPGKESEKLLQQELQCCQDVLQWIAEDEERQVKSLCLTVSKQRVVYHLADIVSQFANTILFRYSQRGSRNILL
jgi:hypothetical protein